MFDQLRPPAEEESLGDRLSGALFTAVRNNILNQKMDETTTKVHLTLTSKEHSNDTVQSNYLSHFKYGIALDELVKSSDYVHALFESLARKMNSAQNMNAAWALTPLSPLSRTLKKVEKVLLQRTQDDYHLT